MVGDESESKFWEATEQVGVMPGAENVIAGEVQAAQQIPLGRLICNVSSNQCNPCASPVNRIICLRWTHTLNTGALCCPIKPRKLQMACQRTQIGVSLMPLTLRRLLT